VALASNEENGNITLFNDDGNIWVMIGNKDDANIHLADRNGHITWTTLQQ
jgi:hypothetical protein